MSIFLLVLQFLVVYLRVLPYLDTTFGRESEIYLCFLILGFPLGLFFLDFLMFLEPFGLLTILPFPPWMKQFIPAYKATRVIAEVVIESLPQSMLQGYIYVVVINHCGAAAAAEAVCLPREYAMMESLSTLPKSILISTLATLKTWIELVFGARAAGLTVMAKGLQLWHVGAGLPLDALKKGTIVEWACPYELDESEVAPLIDALTKNGSLIYLNLAKSGITFSGKDPTGLALVEKMAHSAAALSSIKVNGFEELSIAALLSALNHAALLIFPSCLSSSESTFRTDHGHTRGRLLNAGVRAARTYGSARRVARGAILLARWAAP